MLSENRRKSLYDESFYSWCEDEEYKKHAKSLEKLISNLEVKQFRKISERLTESSKNISYAITLPVLICAYNAVEMQNVVWEIKSRIQSGVLSPDMQEEDKWKQYQEVKQKIFISDIEPAKEELITRFLEDGENRFKHLVQDDFIAKPYKAILYSGIVLTWCNFEMTMKDLWECALNMAGKQLLKETMKNISKKKDTGKTITIDYLAKFEYNLSNKIGTALLSKFNFDSLSGLKEAFYYAFPRSTYIKKEFESSILVETEAKRNVIAHRAGIIDIDYCLKTSTNKKETGKELEISSKSVEETNEAITDIALNVIKSVSSIVIGSRRIK